MLTSELIKELQEILSEYGDIPVVNGDMNYRLLNKAIYEEDEVGPIVVISTQ